MPKYFLNYLNVPPAAQILVRTVSLNLPLVPALIIGKPIMLA